MLNQEHPLVKNNKLISNEPYEQKYTNYPKNLIHFDIENNTTHETQKPVKLIEYLLKTYSNENDVVLDIGGNDGSFLQYFNEMDVKVVIY